MTRRERLRENTRDEIKAIARQQLADGGSAALSLNAIARAMEVTPPALYRYFASRDELITALIVDAYHALATYMRDCVAEAPDQVSDKLFSASWAYRAWAFEHRADFLLLFGTPIPGYAPPTEVLHAAAKDVFLVFLKIMQHAFDQQQLHPPAEHIALQQACEPESSDWPIHPLVNLTGIAAWTRIHGIVMLELTGYLDEALNARGTFYRMECKRIHQELKMPIGTLL